LHAIFFDCSNRSIFALSKKCSSAEGKNFQVNCFFDCDWFFWNYRHSRILKSKIIF
jgi:hypothetical protein